MKSIYPILIVLLSSLIHAQYNPGSRQIALAHSDASMEGDPFSLFGNPAGSSAQNNIQIGFFISPSPFGLKQLSSLFFVYMHPTEAGNFSVGAENFGFKLYRENKLAAGYSLEIDQILQLGAAVNYNMIKIQGYGSESIFDLSIGAIYKLDEVVKIGFSLRNFLRTNSSAIDDPLIYDIGFIYKIKNKNSINIALCKDNGFPFSPRLGVEVFPVDFLALQAGIKNNPKTFGGGISLKYEFFNLGIAVESHTLLGITYQGDIIITLE